jgi:hypothetical protein
MEGDDLKERIHALETAQATQAASTAGMEATQTLPPRACRPPRLRPKPVPGP